MAESAEKATEKTAKKTVEKVDVGAFVARKMKALNEMEDKDAARLLAKRLMMNKRGK